MRKKRSGYDVFIFWIKRESRGMSQAVKLASMGMCIPLLWGVYVLITMLLQSLFLERIKRGLHFCRRFFYLRKDYKTSRYLLSNEPLYFGLICFQTSRFDIGAKIFFYTLSKIIIHETRIDIVCSDILIYHIFIGDTIIIIRRESRAHQWNISTLIRDNSCDRVYPYAPSFCDCSLITDSFRSGVKYTTLQYLCS